jgi:hypothetical protein
MLSAEVRKDIDQSVLCWLATLDAEGWPVVSPKEVFAAYDDQYIVIADIASPGSVANIRRHPQVSVSFIDIFTQRGSKVRAKGRIVEPHEAEFAAMTAPLARQTDGAFAINHVICLVPKQVESLEAPSYQLFSETTEEAQRQNAMAAYGVQPQKAPVSGSSSEGRG